MQQVDFTAPAGQTQRVAIPGKYVKYLAGNNGGGDASLVLTPGGHGSSKIVLQVGQAYRVAADAQTPDSWTITNNAGGATIIGKLVIGNGQIDDPTIAGTVQVVDGGKARTLSNSAFGVLITIGAVASQFARGQLYNPAGSGVRAVVESISLIGGAGAVGGFVLFSTAALANASGSGTSKLAGGAGSASKVYWDTTATSPPLTAETGFCVQGASEYQQKFVEPLILPPGWGITLYSGTPNVQMQPAWEWYEEPNV